jgi:hypothetical protein
MGIGYKNVLNRKAGAFVTNDIFHDLYLENSFVEISFQRIFLIEIESPNQLVLKLSFLHFICRYLNLFEDVILTEEGHIQPSFFFPTKRGPKCRLLIRFLSS